MEITSWELLSLSLSHPSLLSLSFISPISLANVYDGRLLCCLGMKLSLSLLFHRTLKSPSVPTIEARSADLMPTPSIAKWSFKLKLLHGLQKHDLN